MYLSWPGDEYVCSLGTNYLTLEAPGCYGDYCSVLMAGITFCVVTLPFACSFSGSPMCDTIKIVPINIICDDA